MRIKEKLPTPPATTGVSYRELLHQNHQEAEKSCFWGMENIGNTKQIVCSAF